MYAGMTCTTMSIFCTVPGFFAWRDVKCGSWFIQSLCKVLQECWVTLDILSILTLTGRLVAKKESDGKFPGKKQMPFLVSMLTKRLFFNVNENFCTIKKCCLSDLFQDAAFSTQSEIEFPVYNMGQGRRGIAVLFCHGEFLSGESRKSTVADRDRLQGVFDSFGFEVRTHEDLTLEEIDKVIFNLVFMTDHKDTDCLVISVVTKGTEHTLFAKDEQYLPQTLWRSFCGNNCLALVGKPKLFFIEVKNDGGSRVFHVPKIWNDFFMISFSLTEEKRQTRVFHMGRIKIPQTLVDLI